MVKYLLLIALIVGNQCFAKVKPTQPKEVYLHVNHNPSMTVGMFSVFCYVAGVLNYYEKNPNCIGLEVDFETYGLYYEPSYGRNWWEYYCEPIKLGEKRPNTTIRKNDPSAYVKYAYSCEDLDRHVVKTIIDKYIKIKPHILDKVEEFYAKHLQGENLITVHFRGTDKNLVEAMRIPYHFFRDEINQYIQMKQLDSYTIYVASDEQQFVDFMLASFPDRVVTYDTKRSTSDKPLHLVNEHPYQHGEDALVESLLLAKGSILFRTPSNLSLWSGYFNPEMMVFLFDKRYLDTLPYNKRREVRKLNYKG